MKIIILCAGSGKRLNIDKPKCLLKINGKTILYRTLSLLKKNKIKENQIYLALGYKNNIIVKNIKKTINYRINKDYKKTNMVFSLFNCLEENNIEDIVILYGDIYYSNEIIKKIVNSKNKISTVIDKKWKNIWELKDNFIEDLETLKLRNNKIVNIGGKTNNLKNIDARYVGATRFSKNVTKFFYKYYSEKIKSVLKNEYLKIDMTKLLMIMIKQGFDVKYIAIKDFWFEFDNRKDLKLFNDNAGKLQNKESK